MSRMSRNHPLALTLVFIAQSFGLATPALAAPSSGARSNSAYTSNRIPVQVDRCSSPRITKDATERSVIGVSLPVVYCVEKVTFQEREDGVEGWGIFKHTRYTRVAGTEKYSYEVSSENLPFELTYDSDQGRGSQGRDVTESCERKRGQLLTQSLTNRSQVKCR